MWIRKSGGLHAITTSNRSSRYSRRRIGAIRSSATAYSRANPGAPSPFGGAGKRITRTPATVVSNSGVRTLLGDTTVTA
jgi:hypothetical protein